MTIVFMIMNRMSSIGEMFLVLPNQSLSIEYEQLSCIFNMNIWLTIHFIITRLIESVLLRHVYIPFYLMLLIIFCRYWRPLSNFMKSN